MNLTTLSVKTLAACSSFRETLILRSKTRSSLRGSTSEMWGGLPRKVCTSAHVSGPKLLTFQVIYHTGERMEIRLTSFLLKDAVDYRLVDAVFDERRAARHAPQPPGVGFVLGKEQI